MKYDENEDQKVPEFEVIVDNLMALTAMVQSQNDVILVLLHNLDINVPDWKTKEDIEKEVGPKVQKCIDLMRKIYGPSKADKS